MCIVYSHKAVASFSAWVLLLLDRPRQTRKQYIRRTTCRSSQTEGNQSNLIWSCFFSIQRPGASTCILHSTCCSPWTLLRLWPDFGCPRHRFNLLQFFHLNHLFNCNMQRKWQRPVLGTAKQHDYGYQWRQRQGDLNLGRQSRKAPRWNITN